VRTQAAGVLAGVPFADQVFREAGCTATWLVPEGHFITADEAAAKAPVARVPTFSEPSPNRPRTVSETFAQAPVARVEGPTRALLVAERTALNILSRCSGVATVGRAAETLTLP